MMQPPLGGTAGEGGSPGLHHSVPSLGSCVLPALSHPDWTATEREGRGVGASAQSSMPSKCRAGIGTQAHETTNAKLSLLGPHHGKKTDGAVPSLTSFGAVQDTLPEPGDLLLIPKCLTSGSMSPSLTFPPVQWR